MRAQAQVAGGRDAVFALILHYGRSSAPLVYPRFPVDPMRRLLAALLLLTPALAGAQQSSGIQLGLNLGYRTRTESGTTLGGTQLEGMIVHPMGSWTHIASLALTQMRNSLPGGGAVRENGVEASLLFRRAITRGLGWGAGPVLSYATGCASGGTGGVTYGATTCLVSYANKGTFRPGYALQLDWEKANSRGAVFRAGVRAVGHTVASGSMAPKPGAWVGFSLPLGNASQTP